MAINDGGERVRHPGVGIDGVEFAGFDQRRQHRPVLRPGVVACEEGVLSVERDGADGSFDGIVIDLDTAVGQEQGQAVPVFGDVFEGLSEGGFGGYAGAVGCEPGLEVVDNRL